MRQKEGMYMSKAFKQIADGYRMIAEGYEMLAQEDSNDVKAPKKEVKKTAKAEASEQQEAADMQDEKAAEVTIEDIRAVMRAKNKEGKIEYCQAALKEFGAVKLSDVPAEKYPELMKKVEAI